MDNTLETWIVSRQQRGIEGRYKWTLFPGPDRAQESLRITLNKRLATAAPAIVKRMISRRSPRVLRPVLPFRKGSIASATMFDAADDMDGLLPMFKEQIVHSGSETSFLPAADAPRFSYWCPFEPLPSISAPNLCISSFKPQQVRNDIRYMTKLYPLLGHVIVVVLVRSSQRMDLLSSISTAHDRFRVLETSCELSCHVILIYSTRNQMAQLIIHPAGMNLNH